VVIWSEPAKADLRHIFEYIAHDSRHYARKVTQEIVDKTGILNELPRLGRAVPEIGDDNVRELALYTYRIIYEINAADTYILAVAHKRRELKTGEIARQP
jgi:plasmid stabilization system protein ParE